MAAKRPPKRRRPGAEATRRRLLRAGRRAFSRRGLAGANLREEILRPARVSVGSFYHQFIDKTDLLLQILQEHAAAVRRQRAKALPVPARSFEALAAHAYGLILSLAEADPDLWRIQARERWSDAPRIRRFLRDERQCWIDWLCEEQKRLPGRSRARARRERLSGYLLGLAGASADARLELPRRERGGSGIEALARFTAAGAAGPRPVEQRRPAGGGARRQRG